MRSRYLKIIAIWTILIFATALPASAFDFHAGVAGGSDNEIQVNDSGQVGSIAVGTDGQVVIGNTGNAPSFGTISDGEGIDTSLGAGTLGIACEDASETNKGILEIATDVEAAAEAVSDKALVPSNLGSISVTPDAHKDTHDPEDGSDSLDTAAASEIAGVQAAAEGSSHSFARADHAHQIQHGIVDNHLVTIDHASVADDDYAKFTADGIEGRSVSEVKTDLGLGTGDSPTFVTTKLSGLTDTYLPYHVDDATGLADSPLSTDGTSVGIGEASPSQELDLIGDLELEMTTSDDTGVIYKGANRFIHNFQHPTGNTAVPDGHNTFIGINAGNFTMGSTATQTYHGSSNSAIGYATLQSNTTGYSNSAMGQAALHYNTTGYQNSAMGMYALQSNTTGYSNSAMGRAALHYNTTGYQNSAMGMYALQSNTTGYSNSAMGRAALHYNTTGHSNSAMGMYAGRYIADGSTANTTGDYNTFIGYNTKALADNDQNETVIGYNATGIGSNTIALGNTSITEMRLANNAWISQYNFAGDAGINMFKVNVDDEIYVGATLKTGPIVFAKDSGAATALDMPVSDTPVAGTEESYSFKIDGDTILKIYAEANSAGGIQNKIAKIPVTGGILFGDGNDADQDLISVDVSGSPKIWWDEATDSFEFNKSLTIPGGSLNIGGVTLTEDGGCLRTSDFHAHGTGSVAGYYKLHQGTTPTDNEADHSILWADGSGDLYLQNAAGSDTKLATSGSSTDYILIRDEKAQSAAGGTFTSGAWQTRVFNTEVNDAGGHASLSGNQITLAAGTYRFRCSAPGFMVNNHKVKLKNITDTIEYIGTVARASSETTGPGYTRSEVSGQFTIAGSKVFELQHRCFTTRASNGLGGGTGFGTEVYSVCEFWKE